MIDWTDVLVALIAAAGLISGALISRVPSKAVKRIDQRTKELENNGGGSIKDDVDGMAYAIGRLSREQDHQRQRIDAVLGVAAVHHPEHAELYLALRSNHEHQD